MKQLSKASKLGMALLVPALALAACSGDNNDNGGDAGTNGDDVTLTFMHPHPDAYTGAIELFEKANPGVKIEQQAIPFNEMVTQVQARLGSGDDSLDVIAVDPPRLGNMVYQEFLDPVSDETAAETEAIVSEVGLNSVTWEGQQYAYPIWTSANFLYYNKSALDVAGVDYPSGDPAERLTWEEVVDLATEVQEAGGADYGFAIEQVDRYYALQPLAMSHGAEPGLGGDDGLEVTVNTPEWEAFGEWYASIYESGLSPRGIDAGQMPEVFGTQQVAYFLAAPTRITVFQDAAVADNWGIAPHPYFEGGEVVTPTDSWSLGVSAHSANKDVAHEFAQFLTLNVEGISALSERFNLPPVNKEAYPLFIERMVQLAPEALENLEAIITDDSENHAAHRPSSVGYVEFETTMNKALSDIRNGTDVASTLQTANDEMERQLAKYKN